jgi:hypothetical protein
MKNGKPIDFFGLSLRFSSLSSIFFGFQFFKKIKNLKSK